MEFVLAADRVSAHVRSSLQLNSYFNLFDIPYHIFLNKKLNYLGSEFLLSNPIPIWISNTELCFNIVVDFRTMNTVRKLVLKKGGKYVAIQTYGILGRLFNKLHN